MDMFKKYLKKKSNNLRLKAVRKANEGESILRAARMLGKFLKSPEPIHDAKIHRKVYQELHGLKSSILEALDFFGYPAE